MCYNIIKNLSKAALILSMVLFSARYGFAQGTVSLADDIEDELGIDNNIPDEVSLFSDDELVSDGLIQPVSKRVENVTTTETFDNFSGGNTINFGEDEFNLGDSAGSSNPFGTAAIAPVVIDDNFGENILSEIDDKLFSQMSDIEKQTSLLTLELRREKIKSEIEAVRIQRQKVIDAEEEEKEKKARERAEWENEQQRKLIAEQTKLQEENIKLEKLRQEKVLNAYKNEMLKENQRWVQILNKAYEDTKDVEKEKNELTEDFKNKLSTLSLSAKKLSEAALGAKENYEREVQNLQTQISILTTRIENLNKEREEAASSFAGGGRAGVDNPFASPSFGVTEDENVVLSDEYMILEISGKGEDIRAKISNKSGDAAFFVRRGTKLRSGHIIEEITQTFIRADKKGQKDFIYFSAGGVLDVEPNLDAMTRTLPMGYEEGASGANSAPARKASTDSFIEQMFAQ